MKYLDEFRDPELARRLLAEIGRLATRPWTLMEVCGGQTHSVLRHGIDQLLPAGIELIHGPGCPVCVTPVSAIDRALELAARPEVTLCTFGDMLRVPGTGSDLLRTKSAGGDVRVVYSPLDAVRLAQREPDRQFVFFGIGFETTAPANALAVRLVRQLGLTNFSLLISHVLVPPALDAILRAPGNRVQAFLAAGHVCCVMGTAEYVALAARHRVPIVVTGFEPLDLLDGIRCAIRQLESGVARVENAYARVVRDTGNSRAQSLLEEVFERTDREWRGIGSIPESGWKLRPAYRDLDAETRFPTTVTSSRDAPNCRSGDVLRGALKPNRCPAFGKECTPRTPLGATMVSAEGACAAYYHAGRIAEPADVCRGS